MKLPNYGLKGQTKLTLLIVVQALFQHLLCVLFMEAFVLLSSSLLNHAKSNPITKPRVNERKHCRNSWGAKQTLAHNTIPNSPHLTGLPVLRKTATATTSNKNKTKNFKVLRFFLLYFFGIVSATFKVFFLKLNITRSLFQ